MWNVFRAHDILCCEYGEWEEYMLAVDVFERVSQAQQVQVSLDDRDELEDRDELSDLQESVSSSRSRMRCVL